MSRHYHTNTIIDRFRVRNGILKGLVVYGLIIAMFLPGAEAVAFSYYNRATSGGGGGGEKDATIWYYNGAEWTSAALAMEAEPDKTDSIANSPLFYHNGIMWVKTDMYEEDVKGNRIMKVNLPLEELAGKPDMPEGGLAAELNKQPIKTTSKETAADNPAPVLDQPTSKLEKNLNAGTTIPPVKTAPPVSTPVKSAPVSTPVKSTPPVVVPPVKPAPVTPPPVKSAPVVSTPVTAPPVKSAPVVSVPPIKSAPVVNEPIAKVEEKPVTNTPAKKPGVTTLVIPAPKSKPAIIHDVAPVKPADKPVVAPTVTPVKTESKPVVTESKPIVEPVKTNVPVTTAPKVTTEKPAITPVVQPLAKTDAKNMVAPLPDYGKISNKPATGVVPVKTDVKPTTSSASKPVIEPVSNMPLVYVAPKVTNNKPAITTVVPPLAKTDAKHVTPLPDYGSITNKPVVALVPMPLVKTDAKPLNVPLNYNVAPPHISTEISSISLKPERTIVPLPANFVFALGAKQAPTDTVPKKSSILTDFINTAPKEEPEPEAETNKQEPKKEEDKKKKKDDPAPAPQPVSLDTLKKLIHEEVNNAVGKLPVSAMAPPPTKDTATVELPPVLTINDSIEELRKLNLQLQTELEEKLMLRDKLEGQVDQQRQIKKEAKLGGELGKLDTIKLEDDSYVIRQYKFALANEIFGWHPHWMGESYRNYDYSLLTTLAYFSYEVNPTTGSYRTIHDWQTTDVVELAQEKGCKVVLTATCLNEKDLSLFLANPTAQANFVATIRDLIIERNANGVNINFEKLNYRYRREFVELVKQLHTSFKQLNPNYQISITVPAIDYAAAYDVEALEPYVDLFIMMGYEYTGSYSSSTGPTAPLNGGAKYAQYNLGSSIDAYLKNKVPANKLILAIPYYGVQWEVEGKEVPGKAIKFIRSLSYAQIKAMFPDREPLFYEASLTPYYNAAIAGRYNMFDQIWFDNARSLGMKFDMILEKKLGGVGIWALGMDGGNKEFWNVLEDKFLQIIPVPIDTIEIKKAQTGSGTGWFKSRFTRLINILRRPSTFNPATSNFDNWLKMFMFIGGFTFIISRGAFIVRRLQMGQKWKASNWYLYALITSIAILSISMLMWARVTRFFERAYESSSFLFTIGLILGIILAVIFVFWILPKWLKNKELP